MRAAISRDRRRGRAAMSTAESSFRHVAPTQSRGRLFRATRYGVTIVTLLSCVTLGWSAESAGPKTSARKDVDQPPPPPSLGDSLVKAVRPLIHARDGRGPNEGSRRLMQGFHDSILDWSDVLGKHFRPVPGHPDWGYYGLE